MVLASGGHSGEPDNRHRGAGQWLLVVAGGGLAIVNGRRYPLQAGAGADREG
jgi:hypothetical protein